jgi:gliding motility-associated-like protein
VDSCPGFDDLADADGDGTPDGCDACPNSATGDSDGDTVCDDVDVCPGFDDLQDRDGDGTPDGCDACPDSATDDSDGDTVCDDVDICPGFDDRVDGDGDGVPDGCDLCPGFDDSADNDGDGIPDGCDCSELTPLFSLVPESCVGSNDGAIVLDTVLRGQAPYLLSLNGEPFLPTAVFGALAPGSYTATVQDLNGCEASQTLVVPAAPELTLLLNEVEPISLGQEITLSFLTNAVIDTIIWQLDSTATCTDCPNPVVRPLASTGYSLTIVDVNGCVLEGQLKVVVDQRSPIFIPTAFSPNNDGVNDSFQPFYDPTVLRVRNFQIFDRWGGAVFAPENYDPAGPAAGWDGTYQGEPLNAGVFIYTLEVEYLDGFVEVKSGEILLLR